MYVDQDLVDRDFADQDFVDLDVADQDSFDYGSDADGEPEGEDRREDWDFGDEWEDLDCYFDDATVLSEEQQLRQDLASWVVSCRIPRITNFLLFSASTQFFLSYRKSLRPS